MKEREMHIWVDEGVTVYVHKITDPKIKWPDPPPNAHKLHSHPRSFSGECAYCDKEAEDERVREYEADEAEAIDLLSEHKRLIDQEADNRECDCWQCSHGYGLSITCPCDSCVNHRARVAGWKPLSERHKNCDHPKVCKENA